MTQLGDISLSQSNSPPLPTCTRGLTTGLVSDTNLEGVGWFWWKEGELGSDPWWTGRTTEEAANLTKTQTHPVHNVVTTGLEILIIWIFGWNTGDWISGLAGWNTQCWLLSLSTAPWHSALLPTAQLSLVTSRLPTNQRTERTLNQSGGMSMVFTCNVRGGGGEIQQELPHFLSPERFSLSFSFSLSLSCEVQWSQLLVFSNTILRTLNKANNRTKLYCTYKMYYTLPRWKFNSENM